jgi:hypothetical protein
MMMPFNQEDLAHVQLQTKFFMVEVIFRNCQGCSQRRAVRISWSLFYIFLLYIYIFIYIFILSPFLSYCILCPNGIRIDEYPLSSMKLHPYRPLRPAVPTMENTVTTTTMENTVMMYRRTTIRMWSYHLSLPVPLRKDYLSPLLLLPPPHRRRRPLLLLLPLIHRPLPVPTRIPVTYR